MRAPFRWSVLLCLAAGAALAASCDAGTIDHTNGDGGVVSGDSGVVRGDGGVIGSDGGGALDDAGGVDDGGVTGDDGGQCAPTQPCGTATCGSDSCGTRCGGNNGGCPPNQLCSVALGTPGVCQPIAQAGNPDGTCSEALPAEALPANTSSPTTVVGTGTAASCSYAALAAAVATGGVITFECGADPVSIPITATLAPPIDRTTVIDGGNLITLDGGGSVRILAWQGVDWMTNHNALVLQHLVLTNGKAPAVEAIPTRPAPCSQGFNDGQGGAVFIRDGVFRAIDVTFVNNEAALLGPDTGGGAVYALGCAAAYVSSCTFRNNRASNAGGMGSLFVNDYIYNSLFEGNEATGHGANSDDATKCDYINNGQHEVGSGGNGGAIYNDGAAGTTVTICGTQVRNNHANAFGAALFYTSNDSSGALHVRDSLMFENKQCLDWWEVQPGISMSQSVYDAGNIVNSTFTAPQGWSADADPVCIPYIQEANG